jgi:class I fructose-bisphosphate aldolase
MIILPVDQGFEHGPVLSFSNNQAAYDPQYHFKLAIDANLSAYAAPLGMLEAGIGNYGGQIPTILKINSANTLINPQNGPDQAITASVSDALHLGSAAIGFTIYSGSPSTYEMYEEIREISREAKSHGLAVIIWSYPRGNMSKAGETSIDVVSYGAHIAALLGAHIIKVKLPTDRIEQDDAKGIYRDQKINISTMTDRVRRVVESCFKGRRLVIFSGGASTEEEALYNDARAIRDGGGNGSIIGRNIFQRPREEALKILSMLIKIYQGRA